MSFLGVFKAKQKSIVIDGVSYNEASGYKGRVAPRNQLHSLRRLARFATREKLNMTVVLTGNPLNKAPHGKLFEGIKVVYSKSDRVHDGYLIKTAKKAGRGAILVVENPEIEKLAQQKGLETLRVNTFRKAFDSGGSNGEQRNRNGRSGRNRATQANENPTDKKNDSDPVRSQRDAINELIDLVE